MTGLGIEPRTYGLKVPPGLEPARFFQVNTGQHVHHLGVLVWAHKGLVPLYVPLPWNGHRRCSVTVHQPPSRLRGESNGRCKDLRGVQQKIRALLPRNPVRPTPRWQVKRG